MDWLSLFTATEQNKSRAQTHPSHALINHVSQFQFDILLLHVTTCRAQECLDNVHSGMLTRPMRAFVHRLPAAASKVTRRGSMNHNSFAALSSAAALLEEQNGIASKASNVATASTKKASAAKSKQSLHDPLVWVDLEMTGLDLHKDTIIEIAVIITDGKLQHVIEGPALAIHQPAEVMNNMNDWCKEHHGKSGLTQRVLDSSITMEEAQAQVLSFVKEHIPHERSAQLAGNSVHVDRMFLTKYMPELTEHLHYRIVDVSTIKELAKRWFPKEYKNAPRKRLEHTAMSDIRESIEELRHWKSAIFKK